MFSLIKQAVVGLVAVITGIGSQGDINEPPASFDARNDAQIEIRAESLPEAIFQMENGTSTRGVDEVVSPIAKKEEETEQGGDADDKPAVAADCTSCVTWARQHSDMQPPRVKFAKEIPILYERARPGSWIVFGGKGIWGTAGHTGIVRKVDPENPYQITFEGCNYPSGQRRIMTINAAEGKYDLLGFFDTRHK